ncbi:TPA: ATP-dependent protease LonB [Candidatus Micrarchaeota archaeon]|nr:ATP-dependent protease LonB [Candidatus Micrarchaeota archaeon]HIH30245.1 ATP-dependent protease LonB [Candidatus Micrarchaeota archaeon]
MAEMMPAADLEDVLICPNPNDENRPLVKTVKTYPSEEEIKKDPELAQMYAAFRQMQAMIASITKRGAMKKQKAKTVEEVEMGQGRMLQQAMRNRDAMQSRGPSSGVMFLFGIIAVIIFLYMTGSLNNDNKWFVLATIIGFGIIFLLFRFTSTFGKRLGIFDSNDPKLIVDNSGKKNAAFVDATGSKAGALLGDVKHDPLQSGGMGTPAHLRVEAGAIHRANGGVLFIDEVASLKPRSQQELLTAMQEKKYSITGQSENSSGAIVKTEPVPCDFVLVAAGNAVDMRMMHPAMRSRIRGNGYEVYVQDTVPDTAENEDKYVQFVAQEIRKDRKIPHFTYGAVGEIIDEARRKAGRKRRLSLNFRELGGLVRAAGDIANEEKAPFVDEKHIVRARGIAQTIEQQMSRRFVESRKDYQVFGIEGSRVGKVNGLAVLGDASSGLVMPIVAEVTPASSKSEGKLIATGKLGTIAKEAVENVSAIIKKHIGKDVSQYDMHVQFLQTYEGVEGDSASISIAVAIISAMEGIPVRQDLAMTGSLSVRGEVLPVGGVTGKAEAAIDAGMKSIMVPKSNADDIYLTGSLRNRISIIPVENFVEVLRIALVDSAKKRRLISKMTAMLKVKKGRNS